MTEIAFCFCPVCTFFTSKCLYQHIAYHYVLETVKHTHHAEQNFRSAKNYNITDWHDGLYSEISKSEWSNGKTSCRFCEDFSNTSFLYGYNPIKSFVFPYFFKNLNFTMVFAQRGQMRSVVRISIEITKGIFISEWE